MTPLPPAHPLDVFLSPYYGWVIERLAGAIRPDRRRDVREVVKSHVNYVVADTAKWEQSAAYSIDVHPKVEAFVKNAGLGFAIPYHHNGEPHDYVPDFIVRLAGDAPAHLIVETNVRAFLAPYAPREARRYRGGHDLATLLAEQRAWQRALFDAGWAVPAWPREYGGRGLAAGQRQIWGEELRRIGRADSMLGGGLHMLGPTLIQHGSEAQKTRFLGPTARADVVWCQLFSEPGAGSDLAALATCAVRDGDDGW